LLLDGLIWIKSERKIVAKARISVKEQHKAAKRDPLHFHDKHKKALFSSNFSRNSFSILFG
jgi:hypothetical protein